MKEKVGNIYKRLSTEQKVRLREIINPNSNVVFVNFKLP